MATKNHSMRLLAPPAYRRICRILVGLAGFVTVAMILSSSYLRSLAHQETTSQLSKAFVVASIKADDTSWLHQYLADWEVIRYVADDSRATFTVPQNKGQEAMAYLTYIIDNYDNFPDVVIFMHSGRYQWHNDDPIYDNVPLLQSLQLPYILSQGYANLRCVWDLGCPAGINLDIPPDGVDPSKTTEIAYPQAFQDLFPEESLPSSVGVACCAQFAVTRETIRMRPQKDYLHYRQWLLDTPLENQVSGRVLEYSWHIIFGKPAVHCPNAKECYCNTYGLCNLECEEEGKCGNRWPFPPFATLPKGWPTMGWDGESRSQESLADMRHIAVSSADSNENKALLRG